MTEESKALAITERALTDGQFKKSHNDLAKFVKTQLRETKSLPNNKISSGDYGVIPYTNKKSLLKPGAEKLLKLFGLTAHMEQVKEIEDFEHGLVLYKYRCTITHASTGTYIADAVRSCNNKEAKHRTKDVYDVANTIESIAQKRALVAATVQATMASEIFDADVSDNDEEGPGETVTKEEDPKRARVTMGLYGTAARYGWNDKWIHTAIKKKWNFDSLTQCSNDQIEELKEMIMEKYVEVLEGDTPQLKRTPPKVAEISGDDTESTTPEVKGPGPLPWEETSVSTKTTGPDTVEGEVVEDNDDAEVAPGVYQCKGPRHDENNRPATSLADPWCSDQCEADYFGPRKSDNPDKQPWKKWANGKKKDPASEFTA